MKRLILSLTIFFGIVTPFSAFWSGAVSARARVDDRELVTGVQREFVTVPFKSPRGGYDLDAMLVTPTKSGRYPLALISHGSPRSSESREGFTPSTYTAIAIEFARRGYATLVLMRRGYGQSEGAWAEGYGSCDAPKYEAAGRASAQDLKAAIEYAASGELDNGRVRIDAGRVLLAGVSAGGFASIAAAGERLPGLIGVINFAGGRGSTTSDEVCEADQLVAAYGVYGRTSAVPTVWLYAENDHFFQPALARRMFAAFQRAGGRGTLIISPAFGTDGHAQFSENGMPNWRSDVDRFLRANQLPTWPSPIKDPAPSLAEPAGLSAKGREEFARYLASNNFNKAFAVNARGGYGWRTGRRTADDAADDALEACEANNSGCKVYAIDNRRAPRDR